MPGVLKNTGYGYGCQVWSLKCGGKSDWKVVTSHMNRVHKYEIDAFRNNYVVSPPPAKKKCVNESWPASTMHKMGQRLLGRPVLVRLHTQERPRTTFAPHNLFVELLYQLPPYGGRRLVYLLACTGRVAVSLLQAYPTCYLELVDRSTDFFEYAEQKVLALQEVSGRQVSVNFTRMELATRVDGDFGVDPADVTIVSLALMPLVGEAIS